MPVWVPCAPTLHEASLNGPHWCCCTWARPGRRPVFQEAHVGTEPGWGFLGAPRAICGARPEGNPASDGPQDRGGRGLHDQQRQRQWTKVINENCSRTSPSHPEALLSPLSWSPSAPRPKPREAIELTNDTEPQTLHWLFCLVSPGVTTTK